MEDEYGHIRFAPKAIDGSAPGITTRGTHDGQLFPLFTRSFRFVATLEEVRKKVTKELEGDVFEGICGAMEELEDIFVAGLVSSEGVERGDVRMAPRGGMVCGMDEGGEV